MKQEKKGWFILSFIGVIVAYIAIFIFNKSLYPVLPIDPDISNYATSLLQVEHPELYTRDPIFSDGTMTQMFWASGYLYMRLFQGIHTLTNENISHTLAFLQLIPSVLSVITFYWLLSVFRFDRWITLLASVSFSVWALLFRYNGIPSLYYYACIPIFLRLLWENLIEPSFYQKSVRLGWVFGIGLTIGLSPALINSVNGLAFCLLTLGVTTLLLLVGRMKWSAYAALLMGLLPILAFTSLSGTGGGRLVISDFAALNLAPTLPKPASPWQFYAVIGPMLALSMLWLRFRPGQLSKFIFLMISWIFWFTALGNITFFLFLYFTSRIRQRRDDSLDYMLIFGLNISILIGPVLLWILGALWTVTHIHFFIFIMWQMFRFHLLGYFIASIVIFRMIFYLTELISDLWIRRLTQCGILILFMNQAYTFKIDYRLPLLALFLMSLTIVSQESSGFQLPSVSNRAKLITTGLIAVFVSIATFVLTRSGTFNGFAVAVLLTILAFYTVVLILSARRRNAWGTAVVLLGAAWVIGIVAFNGTWPGLYDTKTPYVAMSDQDLQDYQDEAASKAQFEADIVDMALWLRDQTPVDSLVHLHQTQEAYWFFRYLTQRSLLFSWMDQVIGLFSHVDAERNYHIFLDVSQTQPTLILSSIARYNVDYVVLPSTEQMIYPAWFEGGLFMPVQVYRNSNYDVYKIETLSLSSLIRLVQALSNITR